MEPREILNNSRLLYAGPGKEYPKYPVEVQDIYETTYVATIWNARWEKDFDKWVKERNEP